MLPLLDIVLLLIPCIAPKGQDQGLFGRMLFAHHAP